METMLLHASMLSFEHPISGKTVTIDAPLQLEFEQVMNLMGWA
jgi:tRNA pseudouridine65 synthase